MKKNILIVIVFLFLFTFSIQSVFAANVSINTATTVNTGENLDVAINTDTGGVLINSTELVIQYDPNLLSFNGYSDENSVIKLWIDPPHADKNNPGKIYLSGIIPGGVMGLYDANKKELSPVPLVHLFFTGKTAGAANFSFISSKILQHDGLGTPLLYQELGTQVKIQTNTKTGVVNDATAPNTTPENPPPAEPFDPTFLVILLIVVSSLVGYKLLKYKYEK